MVQKTDFPFRFIIFQHKQTPFSRKWLDQTKNVFFIQPPSEARWFTFWDRRSAEAHTGHISSRVFLGQVALYVGIFGRNSEGREFWPSRTE